MQGRVILRDTTLREGIQVPGSRVPLDKKLRFLALLDEIGIPEAEVGLPDGMTACADLADHVRREGRRIALTSLIPCYMAHWRRQIDLAAEHAIRRVDLLVPVSDHLVADGAAYGLAVEDLPGRIAEAAAHGRQTPLDLSVGLIDACRAPRERVLDLVRPLGRLGISRVVVYDSVGTMIPSRMRAFVRDVIEAASLPILVHCHNDHGLATANSLAAVEGGADALDVAVNGIGGRAGNAALEEVALALVNLMDRDPGIDTTRLLELSRLVAEMTGQAVPALKPIVGRYCFAHTPVMHIRCIAAGNPAAFEPFDPAQVGAVRTYDFSLPVDYARALAPFLERAGVDLPAPDLPALVETLRAGVPEGGWTEDQILERIREFGGQTRR